MLRPADDAFLARLRALLPADCFPAPSAAVLTEPRGRWQGQGVPVAPGSTAEVAALVAACAEGRVALVPHGGGTGLVGGQIMPAGAGHPAPVILMLNRLRRIRALYPAEDVLVAEAGVTLAAVQEAARAAGRLFPLSLASEGSATVGGVLATNAGGVHVLRHGNARARCLGIEAVTADGAIWHGLSRLRKDNAGYDLRDLIIGSEGTLAIITAASLALAPRPAQDGAALLAVPSPAAALDLLALARDQAGDAVAAFELIHAQGLAFLAETGLGQPAPLDPLPDWMVLLDLALPPGPAPEALLDTIAAAALDRGLVTDGTIARSGAQRAAFWRIRDTIPEANRRIGAVSSHDISLPLSEIAAFIEQAPAALAAIDAFRVNCFGHLGDGNLHYNVFPLPGRRRADHDHQRAAVKTAIHDLVHAMGGSVAAEHGVGRLKVADLERYADPVRLALMHRVKQALDPQGILNPGAVLGAPRP
jgi:FAD/FMN-containing dehydrogenase